MHIHSCWGPSRAGQKARTNAVDYVLKADYDALATDKADLLRVLGVADARVKALEAALREDRADFDAINALESVYRIDKVLGTAPETGAKCATGK